MLTVSGAASALPSSGHAQEQSSSPRGIQQKRLWLPCGQYWVPGERVARWPLNVHSARRHQSPFSQTAQKNSTSGGSAGYVMAPLWIPVWTSGEQVSICKTGHWSASTKVLQRGRQQAGWTQSRALMMLLAPGRGGPCHRKLTTLAL